MFKNLKNIIYKSWPRLLFIITVNKFNHKNPYPSKNANQIILKILENKKLNLTKTN